MNVTGKQIVFVNEGSYFNEKGVAIPFNKFSTSISKKEKDSEEYKNAYLEVLFSNSLKEEYLMNTLEEGDALDVDIKEGFLTFREYENKDGVSVKVFQIFVNSVNSLTLHERKDVPFTEKPKAPIKKAPAKKSLKK
jgi:hypothetical protein